VHGAAADALAPGDRVWLRHAKAGELAERFREYHVLGEDGQLTTVPPTAAKASASARARTRPVRP
jgi:D-serine deaminase-like pyridoxal phosphate-dependent protein